MTPERFIANINHMLNLRNFAPEKEPVAPLPSTKQPLSMQEVIIKTLQDTINPPPPTSKQIIAKSKDALRQISLMMGGDLGKLESDEDIAEYTNLRLMQARANAEYGTLDVIKEMTNDFVQLVAASTYMANNPQALLQASTGINWKAEGEYIKQAFVGIKKSWQQDKASVPLQVVNGFLITPITDYFEAMGGLSVDEQGNPVILSPEERVKKIKNSVAFATSVMVGGAMAKAIPSGLAKEGMAISGALTTSESLTPQVSQQMSNIVTRSRLNAANYLKSGEFWKEMGRKTTIAAGTGGFYGVTANAGDDNMIAETVLNGVIFAPIGLFFEVGSFKGEYKKLTTNKQLASVALLKNSLVNLGVTAGSIISNLESFKSADSFVQGVIDGRLKLKPNSLIYFGSEDGVNLNANNPDVVIDQLYNKHKDAFNSRDDLDMLLFADPVYFDAVMKAVPGSILPEIYRKLTPESKADIVKARTLLYKHSFDTEGSYFAPDGFNVLRSKDGGILLYNMFDDPQVGTRGFFEQHGFLPNQTVSASGRDYLVQGVGSIDGTLSLIDIQTGVAVNVPKDWIQPVAFPEIGSTSGITNIEVNLKDHIYNILNTMIADEGLTAEGAMASIDMGLNQESLLASSQTGAPITFFGFRMAGELGTVGHKLGNSRVYNHMISTVMEQAKSALRAITGMQDPIVTKIMQPKDRLTPLDITELVEKYSSVHENAASMISDYNEMSTENLNAIIQNLESGIAGRVLDLDVEQQFSTVDELMIGRSMIQDILSKRNQSIEGRVARSPAFEEAGRMLMSDINVHRLAFDNPLVLNGGIEDITAFIDYVREHSGFDTFAKELRELEQLHIRSGNSEAARRNSRMKSGQLMADISKKMGHDGLIFLRSGDLVDLHSTPKLTAKIAKRSVTPSTLNYDKTLRNMFDEFDGLVLSDYSVNTRLGVIDETPVVSIHDTARSLQERFPTVTNNDIIRLFGDSTNNLRRLAREAVEMGQDPTLYNEIIAWQRGIHHRAAIRAHNARFGKPTTVPMDEFRAELKRLYPEDPNVRNDADLDEILGWSNERLQQAIRENVEIGGDVDIYEEILFWKEHNTLLSNRNADALANSIPRPDFNFIRSFNQWARSKGFQPQEIPGIRDRYLHQLGAKLRLNMNESDKALLAKAKEIGDAQHSLMRDADMSTISRQALKAGYVLEKGDGTSVTIRDHTGRTVTTTMDLAGVQQFITEGGQTFGYRLGDDGQIPPDGFAGDLMEPSMWNPDELGITMKNGRLAQILDNWRVSVGGEIPPVPGIPNNRELSIALTNVTGKDVFNRVFNFLQDPAKMRNAALRNQYINLQKVVEKVALKLNGAEREKVWDLLGDKTPEQVMSDFHGIPLSERVHIFADGLARSGVDFTNIMRFNGLLAYVKRGGAVNDMRMQAEIMYHKTRLGIGEVEGRYAKLFEEISSGEYGPDVNLASVLRLARAIRDGEVIAAEHPIGKPKIESKKAELQSKYNQFVKDHSPAILGYRYADNYRDLMTHARLYYSGNTMAALADFKGLPSYPALKRLAETGSVNPYINDPVQYLAAIVKADLDAIHFTPFVIKARENLRTSIAELLIEKGFLRDEIEKAMGSDGNLSPEAQAEIDKSAYGKAGVDKLLPPLLFHMKMYMERYIADVSGVPQSGRLLADEMAKASLDVLFPKSKGTHEQFEVRKALINPYLSTAEAAAQGFRVSAALRDLASGIIIPIGLRGVDYTWQVLVNGVKGKMDGTTEMLTRTGKLPESTVVAFQDPAEMTGEALASVRGVAVRSIQAFNNAAFKVSGQQTMYSILHTGHYMTTYKQALDRIGKFSKGEIGLLDLRDELALDIYEVPVVEEFLKLAQNSAEEGADYLAKQAGATMVGVYGMANFPNAWNSNWGRLAGQFGQWSSWFQGTVGRMTSRGTWGQRAAALARFTAASKIMTLTGASMGFNLNRWQPWQHPFSLVYGGGFTMDILQAMADAGSGVPGMQDEGNRKLSNLMIGLGLQSPIDEFGQFQSPVTLPKKFGPTLIIPGSFYANDLLEGWSAYNRTAQPKHIARMLLGIPVTPDEF